MKISEEFTLYELEQLAKAYLDCSLSRIEEKELELLLFSTPLSSPILREVRAAMGLETLVAASRPKRRYIKWILRAVACAAVLVIAGATIHSVVYGAPSTPDYACVIIDGYELPADEAERAAMEIQRNSLAMFAEAMQTTNADQTASMSKLNEIIQKK